MYGRVLIGMFAIASPAAADEVRLLAGDRLIGTVTGGTAEAITLETPYAKEIKVPVALVDTVITDETVTLQLDNGDYLSGRLIDRARDGQVALDNELLATPVEVAIADVQTLFKGDPAALIREREQVRLSGRANVGISATRGNTETENLHVNGELRARTPKNRYTFAVEAYREEAAGITTSENALASIKYDHFVGEKAFIYTNASFERDEFQDLKLRSALGIGGGYQFFESPKRFLSVEGGVSYVSEDFDLAEDDEFAAGRWSLNYEHQLLGFMRFFHFQEALLGLEDSEDYVIRTRTGLRFALGRGLRATTQYNLDWDNTPAPGLEERDQAYLLTLGYEW